MLGLLLLGAKMGPSGQLNSGPGRKSGSIQTIRGTNYEIRPNPIATWRLCRRHFPATLLPNLGVPSMKKVLSIDGGGIRGIIPALVLADIESRTEKPIAETFDLIAGTSTGGILALALSTKNAASGKPSYTAEELVKLYKTRGKEIFPRSVWKGVSSFAGWADEKYSHESLEKILDEYFGDTAFGKCCTNVLITSYDIENREPLFLKSWKSEYETALMRDVARATSAAPTYFEPALVPIDKVEKALIDGGVFINSPVVSAYAEAKKMFKNEDILVVSLGTGELTREIKYEEAKDWGKISWLFPLMSCIFDGVADAANYQMKQFIPADKYFRFQTKLDIGDDDMDNVTDSNIKNLENKAKTLIKAEQKKLADLIKLCSANPKANP